MQSTYIAAGYEAGQTHCTHCLAGHFYLIEIYRRQSGTGQYRDQSTNSTWRNEDSIFAFLSFFFLFLFYILGPLPGAICRKEIEQL